MTAETPIAPTETAPEAQSPNLERSPAPPRQNRPPLPSAPLVALCTILALASTPLWEQAPWWSALLLVICATARIIMSLGRQPLPALHWRLGVLALATGALLLKYRTLFDVEPGFGMLLVLVAMKMLETSQPRDFQVLTLLGYFLALCSLFLAQDLPRCLFVGAIVTLLTAALIQLHAGGGTLLRSWRVAAAMFAQALPLTLVLFLFAPRPSGDFRLFPGTSRQGVTSINDTMRPGTIAGIAQQPGRAFRASFPGAKTHPRGPYYWRGLVLWSGNGLDWERGLVRTIASRPEQARGEAVRQHISLYPHKSPWLFALDRPVSAVKGAFYDPGGALRTFKPVQNLYNYEVTSQPESAELALSPGIAATTLLKPLSISPEVQALADSFRAGGGGNRRVAERALAYFQQGGFTYSFTPGAYTSNELDEFLFRRRIGFCEHYAAAFASLMRVAGVPSRVVLGYLGGETSSFGTYVLVNHSDAHAWCEVWIEGEGWRRVDPTSAAAPERMGSSLFGYLAAQRSVNPGRDRGGPGIWYTQNWLRQTQLFWDNLSYQWDLRVLTFNSDAQREFLDLTGIGGWSGMKLLSSVGCVCLALLAVLAFWMRRPGTAGLDRAQRLFARFSQRLARAGVQREPAEGPAAFTARAAAQFPEQAEQIREVGALYTALRYGRAAPPVRELARAVRRVGKVSQ